MNICSSVPALPNLSWALTRQLSEASLLGWFRVINVSLFAHCLWGLTVLNMNSSSVEILKIRLPISSFYPFSERPKECV